MNLNLIITRFCHGTGGKFLSSILQLHPEIQHWSSWLQNNKKHHHIFPQLLATYAQRHFPTNHDYHLRFEPIAPYDTTMWSSTYDRGSNLTMSDLVDYYTNKTDHYLSQAASSDLYVNYIFNRPTLPKFCEQAKIVTIIIDNEQTLQWTFKTLWAKHFIETDSKIIYCPDHPLYCPESSVLSVLKYGNPCEFDKSHKPRLLDQYVYNNAMVRDYQNASKFNLNANNYNINLSCLFDVDSLIYQISLLFDSWNMSMINHDLIVLLHQHWISAQIELA